MYYETIFIVNPDISQENTETLTDDLIVKVEKSGGRIVKRENWGSRPLAYSIANRKRGNYILLVTDGSPDALKTLEHAISLEERIIRCLTTKLTELSDQPSPLMRRAQAAAKREEAAAEEKANAENTTEDTTEASGAEEKSASETASTETPAAEATAPEASTEVKTEATPTDSSKDGAEASA
ncbi:MAG: 30S ribosomal protein S6 [Mariprofundus sp.]|nr:30S ribosomal protein S6 [Mariprofundus sp.]